jgi:hypothetical protein
MSKLTLQQITENLAFHGLTLLSEYINQSTPIKVRNADGLEFWKRYDYIMRFGPQPTKEKPSLQSIINYLQPLGIKVLSTTYKSNDQKLDFECSKGHKFSTTWSSIQNSTKYYCSVCSPTGKKTQEQFQQICLEMGYELLSAPKNDSVPVKVKHIETGITYTSIMNSITQNRLPHRNTSLMTRNPKKEIEDDGNVLLTPYKNCRTKMDILCPEGHIFSMCWDKYRGGCRCPQCKSSKGERKIARILQLLDVEFSQQYTFPDCKYITPLKFDFAIHINGVLTGLIEYNGIQHYEAVKHFGGEENLSITQVRDAIKSLYCSNNNIPLLVIKYDQDIEVSIKEFLCQN